MTIIKKVQCKVEGCDVHGKDNVAIFENGSYKCFACGDKGKIDEDTVINVTTNNTPSTSSSNASSEIQYILENGRFEDLATRKLSKRMCEKYGIYTVNYMGEWCLAFARYKDNEVVGFKLKYANGSYRNLGSNSYDLYGSQSFDDPTNRTSIITEGELDAPSIRTVLGDMYHATSLNNGAGDAVRFCEQYYDKLIKYKDIVLCFDMDEPGQKATQAFIKAFNQIGKIRVAKLPLKDANDMLKAGRENELKWAILKAEAYKPKHIATLGEYKQKVLSKPTYGKTWPWEGLNQIDFGAKTGKCIAIIAPPDVGKTTMIQCIATHFKNTPPVWDGGMFFLEQKLEEVGQKLAGHKFNKNLTDPDNEWWDSKAIEEELDDLDKHLYFYDPSHGIDFQSIVETIYYFVNVNKVKYIVLDNLTTIISNSKIDGKRASKEELGLEIGNKLDRLAIELDILIILICHTNTNNIGMKAALGTAPKTLESYKNTNVDEMAETYNNLGLTWQSGRIASINDIDCGKTVAQLFDEIWILSRNMVSPDDYISRTMRIDVAKCKGRKVNSKRFIKVVYDPLTGNPVEPHTGNQYI